MQHVVISREPYLLSMVFSRFILIGKLYKIVIKVCHPYRGFNQQVLDERDSMRLASKIHHPEADKIVALLIGSEYIQPWHPCWYGLLSYIWQANAALYTNK